ncbi:MAG: DUF1616 domain-containing protein [Actinomycetota bacterium]
MRPRSPDLLSAAGLAIAAVAAVWAGAPVAVTTMLGIPLVLLAPGYVWTEVFFGSGLGPQIRAALSVALSLTVTALGGVGLYAAGVLLDRASWLALLAATTLTGAAVAAILRARVRIEPPAVSPGRRSVRRISGAQGARLGLAASIGAAAVGIAVLSAQAQVQPAFTQLSLNNPVAAPGTAQVVVGNHEQRPQQYRLVVITDGVVSNTWTITVPDGASWQHVVPASPGQRLAVDLYRGADDGSPYRHVVITVPSAGAR